MNYNDSVQNVTKQELVSVLRETHKAMIGLLWLIEDLVNFDELLKESHFDDTVPLERAQFVHRILMTRDIESLVGKQYLEFGESEKEFRDWWLRCGVNESFDGAEQL